MVEFQNLEIEVRVLACVKRYGHLYDFNQILFSSKIFMDKMLVFVFSNFNLKIE